MNGGYPTYIVMGDTYTIHYDEDACHRHWKYSDLRYVSRMKGTESQKQSALRIA